MIYDFSNGFYWMPKYNGGNHLDTIIKGSRPTEGCRSTHSDIFSVVASVDYEGQQVHTVIADPVVEYENNLTFLLPGKNNIEQLQSAVAGVVLGTIDSDCDWSFLNRDMFWPSVYERCLLNSMGIELVHIPAYHKHFKTKFYSWNRQGFNHAFYSQDFQVNRHTAKLLRVTLESVVYQNRDDFCHLDKWLEPFSKLYDTWGADYEQRTLEENIEVAKKAIEDFDLPVPLLNINTQIEWI